MNNLANSLIASMKSHPYSMIGFLLSLLPWMLATGIQLNITMLNPAPQGVTDYRGEGLMYSIISAVLVTIIFFMVTLLNLTFQKVKAFYAKMMVTVIMVTVLWYSSFSIFEYLLL